MTVGTLYVNGVDRTPVSEWDVQLGVVTDGVGTMTVTIQDRTNDPTLQYGRQRDLISYVVGSAVRFDGEIVGATLDLPVGMPWRRWKINCTDWNTVLDTRLVGCPDGYNWLVDPYGNPPVAVDPNAFNSGTDKATVAAWFAAYARTSDGRAFDTTSAVNSYIAAGILNDPVTGEPRLPITNSTLRGALDQLRGLADRPIFYWIGPPATLNGSPIVHWTVFPASP